MGDEPKIRFQNPDEPGDGKGTFSHADVVEATQALWFRRGVRRLLAIAAAARIGAKRTFLIHMTHEIEHAATEASLPNGVFLAYDNLVVEL